MTLTGMIIELISLKIVNFQILILLIKLLVFIFILVIITTIRLLYQHLRIRQQKY